MTTLQLYTEHEGVYLVNNISRGTPMARMMLMGRTKE